MRKLHPSRTSGRASIGATLCPQLCSIAVAASFSLACLAAFAGHGFAAEHLVEPDGSGDFPTIQDAITAAAAGDTISLGAGTFLGSGNRDLTFSGKELLLRSTFASADSSVVDCEAATRALSVAAGDTLLVIENISFVSGSVTGSDGGAMSITSGARPVFDGCRFLGSSTDGSGGGAYVSGSEPTFTNCVFSGNAALDGAGLFLADSSLVAFVGCTIAGNEATDDGGGLYVEGNRTHSIERTIVWNNCAADSGATGFFEVVADVDFTCSAVDSALAAGAGDLSYDANTIFEDPLFCSAAVCTDAPTTGGSYTIFDTSPCTAANSPCGLQIGALGVNCVTPTGACCFADGSCLIDTAAGCAGAGGAYEGDATVCSPNPCPQPTGACCATDGSCTIETDADCTTGGGTYQGDDTECSPNPCPQPTGACCATDGSCTIETDSDCMTGGGTYQGDDTECSPNPCPQPTGACCLVDGSCTVDEEVDCLGAGGTYQGADTVCRPNPCPAFTVLPDGSGDYPTIQAAIDGVVEGVNIELSSGIFTGVGNRDVEFRGKELTLRSASGDPDSTIIDCQRLGRGFYFRESEDTLTVVSGIGIHNGQVNGAARGGGIACVGASPYLKNCDVLGAAADANGGGIYLLDSSPWLDGCLLAGNEAGNGGGLYAEGNSKPVLIGSTVTDNEALTLGGGIYSSVPDTLRLTQTILRENCAGFKGPDAFLYDIATLLVVECSIGDSTGVQGSGEASWGVDNVFANPQFCADIVCTDAPDTTGNYTVSANSPALPANNACGLPIGARGEGCVGNPTGACCLPTGGCAILEEAVCLEESGTYQGDASVCDPDPCDPGGACCLDNGSCLVRTATLCTGLGGDYLGDDTGCSADSCAILVQADGLGDYATIQDAIDAAVNGTVVELANGTYVGTGNRAVTFGGKIITLRSVSDDPDSCLVDAEGATRGFYFNGGEPAGTVLRGIGIRNGAVTGSGRGAGIACVAESSPTLINLDIRACVADAEGGAFYASSGSPSLIDCVMTGNVADLGAGVHIEGSADLTLIGCTLSGNRAGDQGGAVYAGGNGVAIERSILWGNCALDGPEIYNATVGTSSSLVCSSVDTMGVAGSGSSSFDVNTLFVDPLFCGFDTCAVAPTDGGDYTLASNSSCLASVSPCGEQIGALGEGCGAAVVGACCYDDGSCLVQSENICDLQGGIYQGDATICDPSPCSVPGACCLPNGSCDVIVETACTDALGSFLGVGTVCGPDSCAAFVVEANGSGDFTTIQDAIDFAGPGATIELGNGAFQGTGNKNLRFYGKPLTLRSQSGRPDSCFVDCEGSGRGLYFRDGEGPDTIVEGIGVRAASLTGTGRGAGVACIASSPTLRNLLIAGCSAEGNGGGVYAAGGTPSLEGCTVAMNVAASGGGVFLEADALASITRTIVYGNCAVGDDADEVFVASGSQAQFFCSDVDSTGVAGDLVYDGDTIFDAPIFCGPDSCGSAPSVDGDYSLSVASPCNASFSPCGELIGALDSVCADGIGACCFVEFCFFTSEADCVAGDGAYLGDGTVCSPDPCPEPGGCCLPDDTCQLLIPAECEDAGGLYLGAGIDCPSGGCSFNAGGSLIVHAEPGLSYQNGATYCDSTSITVCGQGVFTVAAADTVVFHVMASMLDGSMPRVAGVTFGIEYDEADLNILDFGACADFELAESNWPAPGSGTAVTWGTAQTDSAIEVYWFAVEVLGEGPFQFELVEHPVQGASFGDDQVPTQLDPVTCLGSLGFGVAGFNCCQTTSAEDPTLGGVLVTQLHPARPNPTEGRTAIRFDLADDSQVDLSIYDASGRRVQVLRDGPLSAGRHEYSWSAGSGERTMAAGVYFVRLQVVGRETIQSVEKLVIVE